MTTNRGYQAGKGKLSPPPRSISRRLTSEERWARAAEPKPVPRPPAAPPAHFERIPYVTIPLGRQPLWRRVKRGMGTAAWWLAWIFALSFALFGAFALGQSWNGRA